MATLRFRLPASGTAGASPALQSYTHTQGTRRPMPTSDSTALATQAYTPDAADHGGAGDAQHVQFVSDALTTGTIFDVGNRIAFAVQGLEAHQNNNLDVQIWVGVYSNDGSTLRQTLLGKTVQGTELATSLTNRFLATTVANAYTTVSGDRLVVEFSVEGSPGGGGGVQGHNASLRWGSNGGSGDLPENDTETGTGFNPWFEIVSTPSDRQARVQAVEFEVPNAPRRARVQAVEVEAPNAPRAARVQAVEFEVPTAPRAGRLQAFEFEAPNAPRAARLQAFEFEAPGAPRAARVQAVEFEAPETTRAAVVYAFEVETPNAPRQARVQAVELETDDAPRTAIVYAFEFETASAPRTAIVYAVELEIPTAPRVARVQAVEFETQDPPRAARLYAFEFTAPSVGGADPSYGWPSYLQRGLFVIRRYLRGGI